MRRPSSSPSRGPALLAALALPFCLARCAEDEPRTASGVAPAVSLEATGAEPAERAVYVLARGQETRTSLRSRVGMALSSTDGTVPDTGMPAVRMPLELRVEEASPGAFRARFALGDARLADADGGDPNARQALARELAGGGARGLGGTLVVGANGAERSTTLALPKTAGSLLSTLASQLRQALEELSTPLPEVPIGAGARWSATRSIAVSGASLDVLSHYVLRERKDGRLVLDATFTYAAKPQRMELPNVPAGDQAQLVEARGEGSGTLEIALDRPLPVRATLRSTLDLALSLTSGGQTHPLAMTVRTETSVEEAP